MRATRLGDQPIIWPDMDNRMGDNINGPSLIRAPRWLQPRLAEYYLYFSHHDGRYIRLALADHLLGPWRMYETGVLPLENALFGGHVASPDVHVDEERHEIRLYYHGADGHTGGGNPQSTRVARSDDALNFAAHTEPLGPPYFRVFQWAGWFYALAMPGIFLRSVDGLTEFEQGPTLFSAEMRHCAVLIRDDVLYVFYTNAGDCPEQILLSRVKLTSDWLRWSASDPVALLAPDEPYEGGELPRVASQRGMVLERVCQLRDPAIFAEDGRTYLLYSVAGEQGIAIAELLDD
jgi:hypothetical protein